MDFSLFLQLLSQNYHYLIILGILISAQISRFILPKIKEKINQMNANRKNQKLEKLAIVNSSIKVLLEELRVEVDADRVCICQFHNGTHFLNESFHSVYFTCTYQANRIGVKPIEMEKIPLSSHDSSIIELFLENYVVIEDVESHENDYIKSLYLTNRISSLILQKLTNKYGEIIGFILVSWNNSKQISDEELESVKNFSSAFKYL